MTTKVRVAKDMTKAELIAIIKKKARKVIEKHPVLSVSFFRRLKYEDKATLRRIATRMRVIVDKDGYDIIYSK